MTTPLFDANRLRQHTFVNQLEYHASLPSTNDLALQLAQSAATTPERRDAFFTPLLILCDQQTAGRGRRSNQWWSQSGALTFTLMIDTEQEKICPEIRPRVSLAAAVAIARTVEHFLGRGVSIKWPNDVFVGRRKIAGILTEVPPTAHLQAIGIGLNANNSFASAPPEISANSTSIFELTQETFSLDSVLLRLLDELQSAIQNLTENADDFAAEWQSRDLLREKMVAVQSGPRTLEGRCLGIDIDGSLQIAERDQVHRTYGGQVKTIVW